MSRNWATLWPSLSHLMINHLHNKNLDDFKFTADCNEAKQNCIIMSVKYWSHFLFLYLWTLKCNPFFTMSSFFSSSGVNINPSVEFIASTNKKHHWACIHFKTKTKNTQKKPSIQTEFHLHLHLYLSHLLPDL